MDDAAFARLMEESMPAMYRVAMSILRRQADAQDAVQQALLNAWAARGRARRGAERAWLMRILINECRNVQRYRMRVLSVESVPETPYAPPDGAFQERMTLLIHSLPREKEERLVKKRLTVGLVFMLLLALAVMGALGAATDWNVLDFLFRSRTNASDGLMQTVNVEATDGQTTLTISSAMTDGDTLALDWTIHNNRPDSPVFLIVDSFTVNGARVWTDGTDGFDNEWLPGAFSQDGWMRDGEKVALPDEVKGDGVLHVEMIVGAYHPTQEIYQMEEYDPELAKRKFEEGYLVIPEGEGFVMADDEDETDVMWVARMEREGRDVMLDNGFTRTEITAAFDLDMAEGAASLRTLETEAEYRFNNWTARYAKACISPLGLYLTLDFWQDDGEALYLLGDFRLTDGEEEKLETPWPEGVVTIETEEDGAHYSRAEMIYYGLTEDQLPDVISLSYFSDDGAAVFPVRVR